MQQEQVGYTLTVFGSTITFTTGELLQAAGFVAMVAGLYLTYRGQQMRLHEQQINRERTSEMRRSNDLKERELNAEAKDSSQE